MRKPFQDLSPRGRLQRLRGIALQALGEYDLVVKRVRPVANGLNTLFRVDTAAGQSCALRISHPTWRTDLDLASELLWLDALARGTEIGAPVPIRSRQGEWVTWAAAEGVPERRRCVLMSWIPGVNLIERLTEPNLRQLGALAARLHEHAASPGVAAFLSPPSGFTQRRLSGIFARDEENLLFADASRSAYTDAQWALFQRVEARVREGFARLYADPAGLRPIHNDLHQENVKVAWGRLRPFDFEDVIWGYPVQDIAMTFYDLLYYTRVSPLEYQRLRAAFRDGYSRPWRRCAPVPWPEAYPGETDLFIAGRMLWRTNYVLGKEPPHAAGFITRLATVFELFCETGVMGRGGF
jgi:Ser/Thr protein kinase RdoA (MazF antagonist)